MDGQAQPRIINDIDEPGAAEFLVKHHVPFIGPDMGQEMLKILRRLENVRTVYPLPPTVEAYRLSLMLAVQIATAHQAAFCDQMDKVLSD